MFHAQRLGPFLQHIGVFAFRQLQASVQRNELDFLSLSIPKTPSGNYTRRPATRESDDDRENGRGRRPKSCTNQAVSPSRADRLRHPHTSQHVPTVGPMSRWLAGVGMERHFLHRPHTAQKSGPGGELKNPAISPGDRNLAAACLHHHEEVKSHPCYEEYRTLGFFLREAR